MTNIIIFGIVHATEVVKNDRKYFDGRIFIGIDALRGVARNTGVDASRRIFKGERKYCSSAMHSLVCMLVKNKISGGRK